MQLKEPLLVGTLRGCRATEGECQEQHALWLEIYCTVQDESLILLLLDP